MTHHALRLKVLLVVALFVLTHYDASAQKDSARIDDLGWLPESFEMELDSLLNERYKQYHSLSKPNATEARHSSESADQTYRHRVQSMESAIPLTYNPIVREAIDLYVNKRSTLISNMLARSAYYFPMIEEELDKAGLPLELKYLAIVESALNPTAVSRMGATGLWQFMLRTGKIYGLRIDSLVDERRDPHKSTRAMCRYFTDMYSIYGDWMLSIAAYNCGAGNVNKAIRRSGGATDFWQIYPYLPRETRSYVPFYIAAFYAMEHYQEHEIRPSVVTMPLAVDTVHINRRTSFEEIARMVDITVEQLQELNPEYKKDIIPGNSGTQILTLPTALAPDFVVKEEERIAYEAAHPEEVQEVKEPSVPETRYYKVRRGDTLSGIAKKYRGVSVNDIRRANGIKGSNIKPGQRLIIPYA